MALAIASLLAPLRATPVVQASGASTPHQAAGSLPIGGSPLQIGDRGPAVAVLQGDLSQFGDAPGPVDGIFGPLTRAALERFQRAQHLPPTGVMNGSTFLRIRTSLGLNAPHEPGQPVSMMPTPGKTAPAAVPSPGDRARTTLASHASISPRQPGDGTQARHAPHTPSSTAPVAPHTGGILAYWAVWGSNTADLADLRAHAHQIGWLSPYWYTLEGNATLSPREDDQSQVLALARSLGVRVIPMINEGSGVASLLSSAPGRSAAVAAVAALLRAHPDMSGVMIDFELLPAGAKSALTAFIAALRATLPAALAVGIAVMPKSSSPGPSYAQVFDYAQLGRFANIVQIMTYDRHSPSSGPGPISPNDWVSRVAQFAASVIPPAKVYLGVPGYGYDWTAGGATTTVTDPEAAAEAAQRGITPALQASSGELHFQYRGAAGGLHTVWFESPSGIAAKAQMVAHLGLGGLALWTLGDEQPSFWPAAAAGGAPPG